MSKGPIMGIDHGVARIGIAMSDTLLIGATPHTILNQKSRTKTIEAICRLVEERSVEKIVIGLPTDSDGFLSRQAELVLEWAEALGGNTQVPIVFWDESYSSVDAEDIDPSARRSGKSKDDIAAAIILQSYLDALRTNDEPGQTIEAIRRGQ